MTLSHRNSHCLLIITQHVAPAEIKAIHMNTYSLASLMYLQRFPALGIKWPIMHLHPHPHPCRRLGLQVNILNQTDVQ